MDVYIYALDLTKDKPEIEIIPGQAVKHFNIGKYIEYDIEYSVGPNDKETIMYGFSNKELNVPFFSTNEKCVLLVTTDDSNEFDAIDKVFKFCDEECTKMITKAKQIIRGMDAASNRIKKILHGTLEEEYDND